MPLTVRGCKFSVSEQPWPAPLEVVSLLGERFDSRIKGNSSADLVADLLRRGEANLIRQLRTHPGRHLAKNFPFRFCRADSPTGDFGRTDHAALGRGLRSAAERTITGPGCEHDDRAFRPGPRPLG